MLYEAKQGTKAYEYIKSILDAEFEEHQAYMKRVEEAVGFEFEKYQGYQPNRTLTRVYNITAIWVLSERYDTLDKKVWKKIDGVKFRQKVVPGDTLLFRVELLAPIRRGISTMKGYAFVGEKVVCEAEFMAQIVKNK